MRNLLRSFIREESGEDLIEYGLLSAFVGSLAIAVLAGDNGLRDGLINCYRTARSAFDII